MPRLAVIDDDSRIPRALSGAGSAPTLRIRIDSPWCRGRGQARGAGPAAERVDLREARCTRAVRRGCSKIEISEQHAGAGEAADQHTSTMRSWHRPEVQEALRRLEAGEPASRRSRSRRCRSRRGARPGRPVSRGLDVRGVQDAQAEDEGQRHADDDLHRPAGASPSRLTRSACRAVEPGRARAPGQQAEGQHAAASLGSGRRRSGRRWGRRVLGEVAAA